MVTIAVHTLLGAIGSVCIFAIFVYLSGAKQTSAPFGLIVIGLSCGLFAHYLSPWATVMILGMYTMGCFVEWWQDPRPPS